MDTTTDEQRPIRDRGPSEGGRAAAAGHAFQDEVCAYHMVLMLAGEATHAPAGLSMGVVTSVWPQANIPVSDVVVTTSQAGAAYVEATTQRLTLSRDSRRSKLHKCLAQFAQLYMHCRAGSGRTDLPMSPWDRALDPSSDRLVIATGPGTSATAVGLLNSMADAARMSAYDAFSEHVRSRARWLDALGLLVDALRDAASALDAAQSPTVTEEDAWRLLQCVRVVSYDFSASGQHMHEALHLLREHVLSRPTQAASVWNDICKVAQTAARQSARMDLLQLRQQLAEIGVPLATAPDYRADVEALLRRSADELAGIDDGICCGHDRKIVVEREVVDEIAASAGDGHVLVHGEPGCGKSWILKQVARRCLTDGECLFLRIENLPVRSQTEIGDELRIAHPLVDVLRAWQSGKNTIFFDGLDAAREEAHARAIHDLIGTVIRDTSWRAVISIRTYDKQYSGKWSQLLTSFGGADGGVSSLSDRELEAGLQQAPDIAAIVERSASELRDLIHNPFNLRLLAEVACSAGGPGDPPESLLGIRSQVELLEKFWKRRVRRGENADARERCVLAAARQMVDAGQLMVATTALLAAAVGTELTDLLSDGIIVPKNPRTDAFVGMFHNAFFDFACARLLLSADVQGLLTLFTDTRRVFFVRPSVRLFFSYLLCFEQNARFWRLCRAMLDDTRLPAIWQIVPLDVLADAFVEADQLRDLLAWLDEPRPEAARVATAFLLRSLETRKRAGPPATRVWLSFCSELSPRMDTAFVNPYLAYLELWSKQPEIPADCAEIVNRCARAVWEKARRDGWAFGRLTAQATEVIARTIAASPDASQQTLSTVATEHDHEECRGLADAIPAIIAVSPSYAADLLIDLFSYEEASEDQVPLMPSHVFSIVQSRKQAWEIVWYALQEDFPALLSASPTAGTRVAIAVAGFLVDDERIRGAEFRRAMLKIESAEGAAGGVTDEGTEPADPCQLISVTLVPTPFCYEEDRSSGWYDRFGADYRHKVLQHFEAWLAKADEDPRVCAALPGVFAQLFGSNRCAVVWNRCLVAARSSPKSLADHVFPLIAASPVLLSGDSEDLVVDLLPAVFPLYDAAHRRVVEQAILSLPECADAPGYRPWLEKERDRYLACLPDDAVVLEETQRAKRALLAASEAAIEPQPGWSERTSWHGLDDYDRHLASAGADVMAESYQRLKQLIAPVEQFVESHLNSAPTSDETKAAFPAITNLDAALHSELAKEAHPVHLRRARTQLSVAALMIVSGDDIQLTQPSYGWAVGHLLTASGDVCPEPTEHDPARDDAEAHLGWGAAPRIEAASGLMLVASRGDVPPDLVLS